MWIVQLALRRPHTVVVLALLILVLGITSITQMRTDIFPEIDIPVATMIWTYRGLFVGFERLNEAGPFFGGHGGLSREEPGGFKDAIDAGGVAKGDILVDHHEGESSITFEGMLSGEDTDLFLFVVGVPVIARHPGIGFVDFAEALLPVVEFARADADPAEEVRLGDVTLPGAGADEIDEVIADIVGDPLPGQGSPRFFFSSV